MSGGRPLSYLLATALALGLARGFGGNAGIAPADPLELLQERMLDRRRRQERRRAAYPTSQPSGAKGPRTRKAKHKRAKPVRRWKAAARRARRARR